MGNQSMNPVERPPTDVGADPANSTVRSSTPQFEHWLEGSNEPYLHLCLYVTGMASRSFDAIATIHEICESLLPGHYQLEVIDISVHPEEARVEQIVAIPTLLKKSPHPPRRLIGDLKNRERIRSALGLPPTGPSTQSPAMGVSLSNLGSSDGA